MTDPKPPETNCPSCGYLFASTTGIGDTPKDATPREGDVSLCLKCLSYLQFDAELRPRILTPSEFQALPDDIRAGMILARQLGWRIDTWGQVTASQRARRSP